MNLTTGIIKDLCKNVFVKHFITAFILLFILPGCGNKGAGKVGGEDDPESTVRNRIEVSVVSPRIGTISQSETFNATTVYMLSDAVRAPINGYIRKVNVTSGQMVKEGDVLFSMQSKEASAMNIIKDTTLHINGTVLVKATQSGIVKNIDRQLGDYVQDGDELCNIANSSSLVFILDVPFELRCYIKDGVTYTVTLPDGEPLKTHITARIPEMDKAVQMERYVLQASSALNLPAGLIANVKIPTNIQNDAVILPKSAILCNEAQVNFWVMKLLHDSLAIKVLIDKGAETKDSVQIKNPAFTKDDKILITGNYGMPDTALVKVTH